MQERNELLISGVPLTAEEIGEVQTLLHDENTHVSVLETKSAAHLVQLIFNDFSAVSFVRDTLLGLAVTAAYTKLKAVAHYLLHKGCAVENVCIEKDFVTESGLPFRLYIAARADQMEQLITTLDSIPKEQLIPLVKNSLVMVRYDEKGNLEIAIM